jgi:hypothetical protein
VFRRRLTTAKPVANVWHVNDEAFTGTPEVLPGDVGVGDIIALPGTEEGLLVRKVSLGQGGFIFLVSAADEPSADSLHEVTLTAQTHLQRLGRVHVL